MSDVQDAWIIQARYRHTIDTERYPWVTVATMARNVSDSPSAIAGFTETQARDVLKYYRESYPLFETVLYASYEEWTAIDDSRTGARPK